MDNTVTFTFGLVFDCVFSYFIDHHFIPKVIISSKPQISYTHAIEEILAALTWTLFR